MSSSDDSDDNESYNFFSTLPVNNKYKNLFKKRRLQQIGQEEEDDENNDDEQLIKKNKSIDHSMTNNTIETNFKPSNNKNNQELCNTYEKRYNYELKTNEIAELEQYKKIKINQSISYTFKNKSNELLYLLSSKDTHDFNTNVLTNTFHFHSKLQYFQQHKLFTNEKYHLLYEILHSYKDLWYSNTEITEANDYITLILMHVINHMYKTRDIILKHNEKIRITKQKMDEIKTTIWNNDLKLFEYQQQQQTASDFDSTTKKKN